MPSLNEQKMKWGDVMNVSVVLLFRSVVMLQVIRKA
jgi:hypothetical protein